MKVDHKIVAAILLYMSIFNVNSRNVRNKAMGIVMHDRYLNDDYERIVV